MSTAEPTIFERIVAREIPADIVFENERVIAFRDIAPKAPVHLLVVPKTAAFANVVELAAEHCGGEFRLIFNTGAAAGQTVFHVHAHVLGGTLPEGSLGAE